MSLKLSYALATVISEFRWVRERESFAGCG